MSFAPLTAEEQAIYDHITELEKAGGSEAFVDAVHTAPMLLKHNLDVATMGIDLSVPLKSLKVKSSWGTLTWEVETVDGHKGSGSGLGYISTDISITSGDLYYITWGLLLGNVSFTTAGVDGYLFIYFSTNSIPAGFIKAKANFGAVAGTGSGSFRAVY